MRLNRSHLQQALSGKGALRPAQFRALGYDGPFKGWKTELVGREFTNEQVREFIVLRKQHPPLTTSSQIRKKKIKHHKRNIKKGTPKVGLYKTPEWIKVRDRIEARDGHACVHCGAKKGNGVILNVHHLLYVPGKEIWDVPDWYLVTLCQPCHKGEHSKKLRAPRKKFNK